MRYTLLSLFVVWSLIASAQTPKYSTPYTGVPVAYGFPLHSPLGDKNKTQTMYTPADFPGVPSGPVTALYMKGAPLPGVGDCQFANFTAKMGYTTKTGFTFADSFFVTGLTTVYTAATFTTPQPQTGGSWFKIPLSTPFQYDNSKFFILELSTGPDSPAHGMTLLSYNGYVPGGSSRLVGSMTTNKSQLNGQKQIIGFDLIGMGVPSIGGAMAVSTFPNPATDELYFSGVDNAVYKITDVTGKTILSGNSNSRLPIDIHRLSDGLYLLHLQAKDGSSGIVKFVKQ